MPLSTETLQPNTGGGAGRLRSRQRFWGYLAFTVFFLSLLCLLHALKK